MVALKDIQTSNANLPSGLVGVFVGATSGIGEATFKQFARHVPHSRAYIIGRSREAAACIIAECRSINSTGTYIFLEADVSLIRNIDAVCEKIKMVEKHINILFLSAGQAVMDRRRISTSTPQKEPVTNTLQ